MAKKIKVKGNTVRFGVIGVGGMGQVHCRSLTRMEETALAAVCDVDPATAGKVAEEYGVPRFTKHKELINSGLCDAVIIVTPHRPRPAIAVEAMKAGLHVLSEKPLSEKVGTADKMIAAAKKYGVAFGIDFQLRFKPEFLKAVELVQGGVLGKIYRRTMISPEYRSQAYYDSGGWRATWEGEGGGVMLNQAPHIMDLFVLLGGMPCLVYGRTETRLHDIEVEDIAEAMLTYSDGGTGYLYCSTNEAGPGQMIEIFGDKGKLCFRDGEVKLYRFEPSISEFTRENKEIWGRPNCLEQQLDIKTQSATHGDVIRNFARHILYGERLVAPGEEGIHSLELANAVWLSAHGKKPVKLPLSRRAYDEFLAEMRRKSTFVKKVRKNRRVTDPRVRG